MKYKIMNKTSVILQKSSVSTIQVHILNGSVQKVEGEWGGIQCREYIWFGEGFKIYHSHFLRLKKVNSSSGMYSVGVIVDFVSSNSKCI